MRVDFTKEELRFLQGVLLEHSEKLESFIFPKMSDRLRVFIDYDLMKSRICYTKIEKRLLLYEKQLNKSE